VESGIVHVPPADRMAFLAERRALSVQRFDTVHSPHYDRHWGAISATHADFVARLARRVPAGGQVLDAACGTGKYWPALLAAGLPGPGPRPSPGILRPARPQHPRGAVPVPAPQKLPGPPDPARGGGRPPCGGAPG